MKLPTFDEMLAMSPEQLNALLEQGVEDVIQEASPELRRKLHGLQFKINAQRQMAKNPMDSCIRISNLMHDSMIDLNEALEPFRK